MSLSLVRVDDRLIHGQVVLMWSKVRQGDAIILLVDDELGKDKFMQQVLMNAGNATGKKVYIFTIDQAIEKIPTAMKSNKKYYLIAKTVQELYKLKQSGVDFGTELIFGTASKKPNTVKVANNIYISEKDMEACDYLTSEGMDVTFKLIPDENGQSWKHVKNEIEKGGK